MARSVLSFLPLSPSTTPLQATTYLLGISLFSISFLVFLNSAVSFVITDLIGIKERVGDIVGTLGFVDEIVALVMCPIWGLVSDRLGVRWVAVLGYLVIGLSLILFVLARNVYPQLLIARVGFAIGATAAATMVTAILPVIAEEDSAEGKGAGGFQSSGRRDWSHNPRNSVAHSLESELTITPERFTRTLSNGRRVSVGAGDDDSGKAGRPSKLAGYVGLFTGCGALVALLLFLPLPAQFSRIQGMTLAQAVTWSFRVVGIIAFGVAIFVFFGLRGLKGEEQKGWRLLFGYRKRYSIAGDETLASIDAALPHKPLPYLRLLRSALGLGFTDPHIALGYLGGFVARASTVAISLFIPLYVNAFFIRSGYCHGEPNDPNPELKKECRVAYIQASILTGVAQLIALLCAPLFGYLSATRWRGINVPVLISTGMGIAGYITFPMLRSPEFKDTEGRGGSPVVFLIVALVGISQIGAIVTSLGSLGRGVLTADLPAQSVVRLEASRVEGVDRAEGESEDTDQEDAPLLRDEDSEIIGKDEVISRVQLKGSIAGVYSWCGGAAILLLTKLGGYLFDALSTGAPFYMMAIFNGMLLVASLSIDLGKIVRARSST